jgi:hypothetical protein
MLQQILGSLNQIVYMLFGGVAMAVVAKLAYDNYKLGKDEDLIQNMKKVRDLENAKESVDAKPIDDIVRELDAEYNRNGDGD